MTDVISATRAAALLGDFDRSPAFAGLAGAIRTLIAEGRVPVGVRLPSERDLTATLGLSRTTVTRAYDQLREERYLESRRGSGSFTRLPVSRAGRTDHLLSVQDRPDGGQIDLTIATPQAPPGTAAAFERAAAAFPAYVAGSGYFPTGVPALREALAARYSDRGLATTPEQIVVVNGALAGTAVVAQALLTPGQRALIETPTYPNTVSMLRARRIRLTTTPVDPEHGWDLDHAARAARGTTMTYLIPDFHNPTGALMTTLDRERMVAALADAGSTAVIDESRADTSLDDDPVPAPFGAHDPDDRVFHVGSASKGWWAGLRTGWIRVPRGRLRETVAARLSLDLASAPLEQLALLEMLAEEDAIRAHHRRTIRASREALLTGLGEALPDWEAHPGRGGLNLWVRLPFPCSTALAVAAEREGVLLASGPAFSADGGLEHWQRLPHTQGPEVMVDVVRRLARAWPRALAGGGGGAGSRREPTPVVA